MKRNLKVSLQFSETFFRDVPEASEVNFLDPPVTSAHTDKDLNVGMTARAEFPIQLVGRLPHQL